jgi:hypothetical protein
MVDSQRPSSVSAAPVPAGEGLKPLMEISPFYLSSFVMEYYGRMMEAGELAVAH